MPRMSSRDGMPGSKINSGLLARGIVFTLTSGWVDPHSGHEDLAAVGASCQPVFFLWPAHGHGVFAKDTDAGFLIGRNGRNELIFPPDLNHRPVGQQMVFGYSKFGHRVIPPG